MNVLHFLGDHFQTNADNTKPEIIRLKTPNLKNGSSAAGAGVLASVTIPYEIAAKAKQNLRKRGTQGTYPHDGQLAAEREIEVLQSGHCLSAIRFSP